MTVRTNRVGAVMVYAGTLDELAEVADAYAGGLRTMPAGLNAGHLKRAADQLRAGYRVHDLGPIRFYGDAADGTPFHGPYAPPTEG